MKGRDVKISFLLLALFVVTLTFVSLRFIAKEESMLPTEREVARVAERYVAAHYNFEMSKYPPIVHDKGDNWEIEYELPLGMIGGTPVVVVEKATSKVLRSFHTQ